MRWLSVVLRGWVFGVVLGLVLGGGLGTFVFPGLGSVVGGTYGAVVGAVAGLWQGLLMAVGTWFGRSAVGDRVWSGLVAGGLAVVVATVAPAVRYGLSLTGSVHREVLAVGVVLASCSAAAGAAAGRFVTCGVPVDGLRHSERVPAVGAVLGALLPVVRTVMEPGFAPSPLPTVAAVAAVAALAALGAASGCALAAITLLLRMAES